MNVAELKKRILRGFAYPNLFYLPIKQTESGIGTLLIRHLRHNTFNAEEMSFTDDTIVYRGMKYVIFNSAKQVVYSNKNFTPPAELEISLPSGKYTVKIIYLEAGIAAKEKVTEIEVIPNKTAIYIMEFFPDLYKHEFLFGSPDGASVFENDPDGEYHHTYYVEKNVYFKTENIYRCGGSQGVMTENLICHIKNVPQMYNLGHIVNAYVFLLGIPTYATSKEYSNFFGSFDDTFEFIGFGEILNSAPVIAYGAYFTEQKAIIEINYKKTYPIEQSGIDYSVTTAHMPTVSGFPPTDFFDETLYDPEIKNALWNRVGNRSVLKNMSSTETVHYKYAGIDVEGWEEVPNGTYIREFTWDDPEFYAERMIVKNRGLNWSFRNSSCMVVINGIKKSVNVFYVYRDSTEYQYRFGGFTYYSDDYDQY